MNSPFCRIGSKKKIAAKLISMFPKNYKIYVEPFLGSGAVYFKKNKDEIEVLNDLDNKLIKSFKLLWKLRNKDFSEYNTTDMKKLNEFFNRDIKKNEKDFLVHQILKCNIFALTDKKIYKDSNPYNKLQNIKEYANRIKGTIIHNEDYINIIKKYDSKYTFFFLDPPYENSKGLYDDFIINYEVMFNLLSNIKGKFLLTINYSNYIKKLFEKNKKFKLKKILIKGTGSTFIAIGSKNRWELIITNY